MRVGLVTPSFPCERRVALLPCDIDHTPDTLLVESGFGEMMGIPDSAYRAKGCAIVSRERVFRESEVVFCLKLLQPEDYAFIREKQTIIGWVHPHGSGERFMREVAGPKQLTVVDLDSISPRVYPPGEASFAASISPGFLWWNSYMAGVAAVDHALASYGLLPNANTSVAVLGAGNVAQGAYAALSRHGAQARMFRRRTMAEFYETINLYDIVVNGIEIADGDKPILGFEQHRLRPGSLVVDAAADANRAIVGTHYTTLDNPVYQRNGVWFYVVNNTPSVYYRPVSEWLSRELWKHVFRSSLKRLLWQDCNETDKKQFA